jgi:hypothetical protein
MRAVFNIFGILLVVIALMLLGADMVTSMEHQGHITVRTFQDVWALFDRGGVAEFNAWLPAHVPSFVAAAVQFVLHIWAWMIGVIGVLITFLAGHVREQH